MNQTESTNPKDRFGRLKVSLTSIPPAARVHMALAMMNGAEKYGPFNWRAKTVAARVYLDAASRHIDSWLDGEENAADSGIHHLGHALASLGIILDAQANGTLVDDRPRPGAAARLLEQFTRKMGPEPRGPHGTNAGDVVPMKAEACKVPPAGWVCSRSEGHDGPCAAHPLNPDNRPTATDARELGWSPQDEHLLTVDQHSRVYDVSVDGTGRVEPWSKPNPRKRRVYIAGPMRGYEKFNFPAFDRARDLALTFDYNPISPADMDRQSGFHEDNPPEAATGPEITRTFVARDVKALQDMRAEQGDAIALLPGWQRSTGAVAEFFLARWLGLAILNANTMQPFFTEEVDSMTLSDIARNAAKTLKGA